MRVILLGVMALYSTTTLAMPISDVIDSALAQSTHDTDICHDVVSLGKDKVTETECEENLPIVTEKCSAEIMPGLPNAIDSLEKADIWANKISRRMRICQIAHSLGWQFVMTEKGPKFIPPETICNNRSVNLDKLKETQLLALEFAGEDVYVYHRTKQQIEESKNTELSVFDSKYPTWWPQHKHKTSPEVSQTKTRSKNNKYFIFWAYGPVFGYYVTYLPAKTKESTNELYDLAFIGENWEGGFIDVTNKIAYDFTGRPFIIDLPEDRKGKAKPLANLNLQIPKYIYNKTNNSITLLCK